MIRCTKIVWSRVRIVTSRTRHEHVHNYAFLLADRLCMFSALDQFKYSCVYSGRVANYSLRLQLFKHNYIDWKTLIIKFPPPRDGKGVKCTGYARGGFDLIRV